MSAEEKHFRSRVPGPKKVDIVITSHFGAKSATSRTPRGRAFLSEFYNPPRLYVDQAIPIQPGKFWLVFKESLRERGLRAQHDGSGNHRQVE